MMQFEQTELDVMRVQWRPWYWPFRVRTRQYFRGGIWWYDTASGKKPHILFDMKLDSQQRVYAWQQARLKDKK